MDLKFAQAPLALKQGDDEGRVTALFSTFGIVDRDGDIVEAGAFTHGQPVPLVWGHDWKQPVGRGVIHTESTGAVFDGRFFLETQAGREAYQTVKAMGDLQQYSWGFQILDSEMSERDGQPVRVIKRAEVFEVSPVLIGAGIGTRTLAIKESTPAVNVNIGLDLLQAAKQGVDLEEKPYSIHRRDDEYCVLNDDTGETVACHATRREALDHQRALMANVEDASADDPKANEDSKTKSGQPLSEQADTVLAAVTDLTGRVRSLADLRAKEGRAISAERRKRVGQIVGALRTAADDLDALLKETEPQKSIDARRAFAEYQLLAARVLAEAG